MLGVLATVKNKGMVASHMRFAHQAVPKQRTKLDFSKAKSSYVEPKSQFKEQNKDSNNDYALGQSASEEEPTQKRRKTCA